ncbi:MAG: DUF4129 domain-containing protein, partial [Chloroflexota bacterium]
EGWEELLARFRPAGQAAAAQKIRRLYAELLELSAGRGRPRSPNLTPLEFLPELQQAFPAQAAESELITRAYTRVRYGEYPEAIEDVHAVESALEAIRQSIQQARPA